MDSESQKRSNLTHLLLRRGARFACVGDALCCSDLHVLGPIIPREVAHLNALSSKVIRRHRTLHILHLSTVPFSQGGRVCVFFRGNGCAIHPQRPTTCRHFPLGLVATPLGLRVTTEHRCPCRSLGPRPPLSHDLVYQSLSGASGQLKPQLRVGSRVHIHDRRSLGFQRFCREIEDSLLASLLAPVPDFSVLGEPYPSLDGVQWRDIAHLLRGYADGESSGAEAVGWFADTLLTLQGVNTKVERSRPWAWAFDRAESRGGESQSAADVLGDWAADVIWSLAWTERGSFRHGLAELATRWAVASEIAIRLQTKFALRADRAAAEAVMMAEMVGSLPLWESVCNSIRTAR